jgi:hypothetical protein
MFIRLLKRCPELEELRLPMHWDTRDNIARMVKVLDSNCTRLHTLNQEFPLSIELTVDLLKEVSKGFRQLYLEGVTSYNRHDPEWKDNRVLNTIDHGFG